MKLIKDNHEVAVQAEPTEKIIPLITLRDVVIFPFTEVPLTFGRIKSSSAVTAAYKGNRLLCFVAQKNPTAELPGAEDLYQTGTMAVIEHLIETNNSINAMVRGIARVKINQIVQHDPYFIASVTEIPEILDENQELQALAKHVTEQVQTLYNLGKPIDVMVLMKLVSGVSVIELANQTSFILDLKPPDKQMLLELPSINRRLEEVARRLSYEIKVLELEKNIASKTQAKFDKGMREAVLRERKKMIDKELGSLGIDEDSDDREIKELKDKIKKIKMPEKAEKKALEELDRLKKMSPNNPEAGYVRTYLDWLVAIPWSKESPNNVSLQRAQRVLNKDHYGLPKVKERILEYLAVMKLKHNKSKGVVRNRKTVNKLDKGGPTILCFIGPPGVGKTSIGRSIAKALGREFVRISLGGIRDEAEIRGHRRTYVGALPGRIVQGIKNAGTINPVFMLDEIDKIGVDFRGDPSSALLEALDPEQNSEFSDHYLEVALDLSKVFFIATGNVLDTIPPALMDRLEIIRFAGYTVDEKIHIAKDHLWQKQQTANGLSGNYVLSKDSLKHVIEKYTREAGVRGLERSMASICRKIARKTADGAKVDKAITSVLVRKYLGPPKFNPSTIEKNDQIGIANGLAWTQAGGDTLLIEVALMPGKGSLLLTGQLGDIMKESCQAAMTYLRSHYAILGLKENFSKNFDVHIHVPEGAVPKDGPSAGVAIATALTSAFTKKKFKRDVAMTGEITLRGRVLEIGGVKEKVLAAHRAGIKTVILPKENKKDLEEVPSQVKKELKFVFASEIGEVLKVALTPL